MKSASYYSKSELVYQEIRDRITLGMLRPGDRFSAQEIAKELGVSRSPVNDAMKKMSEYGLIRILPNVGYEVSLLNWKDIEDIMRIECILETEGLRLNQTGFDQELIAELREINHQTIRALEDKNREDYYRLTDVFHWQFIALSQSKILQDIFEKSRHYAGWDDGKIMEMTQELKRLLMQHDVVLDHLYQQEIDQAIALLKEHSDYSIELVKKSLKNSHYAGIE